MIGVQSPQPVRIQSLDSSYRHTCFAVFMMDIEGIVVPMFGSINAGVQVPQSIV